MLLQNLGSIELMQPGIKKIKNPNITAEVFKAGGVSRD